VERCGRLGTDLAAALRRGDALGVCFLLTPAELADLTSVARWCNGKSQRRALWYTYYMLHWAGDCGAGAGTQVRPLRSVGDMWPAPWFLAVGFCGARSALDHLFWFIPVIRCTLLVERPIYLPPPPPPDTAAWQVASRVSAQPDGRSRIFRCFVCDLLEVAPPGPEPQHFRRRWTKPCPDCPHFAHRSCLERRLLELETGMELVDSQHEAAEVPAAFRCLCGRPFRLSRRFPETLAELLSATRKEWRFVIRRLILMAFFFVWMYTLAEHYCVQDGKVNKEVCVLLAFTAPLMSVSVSQRFHRGIQMIWHTPHRWRYFHIFGFFAMLFYLVPGSLCFAAGISTAALGGSCPWVLDGPGTLEGVLSLPTGVSPTLKLRITAKPTPAAQGLQKNSWVTLGGIGDYLYCKVVSDYWEWQCLHEPLELGLVITEDIVAVIGAEAVIARSAAKGCTEFSLPPKLQVTMRYFGVVMRIGAFRALEFGFRNQLSTNARRLSWQGLGTCAAHSAIEILRQEITANEMSCAVELSTGEFRVQTDLEFMDLVLSFNKLVPSFLCSHDAMIPKLVLVAVCHVGTGALEAGCETGVPGALAVPREWGWWRSECRTRPPIAAPDIQRIRRARGTLDTKLRLEGSFEIEFDRNPGSPPIARLPDELMNDPRWKRHVPPGASGVTTVRLKGLWVDCTGTFVRLWLVRLHSEQWPPFSKRSPCVRRNHLRCRSSCFGLDKKRPFDSRPWPQELSSLHSESTFAGKALRLPFTFSPTLRAHFKLVSMKRRRSLRLADSKVEGPGQRLLVLEGSRVWFGEQWRGEAALSNMLLDKGEMQLGDDLLYVDADALGELGHLLKMREETTEDIVIRKQPHCEHVWTKGEIFERFNTTWDNPHYGLTQQPKAQAYLMRLNVRTSRLLRTWEMLLQDFHLVSDEPSRNTALDGPWHKRKENRHDQSLLSMVIKAGVGAGGREGDVRVFSLWSSLSCVAEESALSSVSQVSAKEGLR
ncbi:unnamed protein product, partial [Symbiodinium sp. CCMP2456]